MTWIWLLASIISEVVATLSLRAADGLRRPLWLLPIVVGYVLAFTFLAMSLSAGMPVGVAYGLWTAIGIVLVALSARVIWHDRITPRMVAGMALIIVGVLLVEAG
ncbi:multidrug efflux SMR transporter [Gordonia sp. HY002]|uniref:DMT family transporter n=1 Tax=Gordonia zhenghanii TaxID=2911516 RepID=UPI001EF0D7F8|nr:multidrug efflux SMR transporter [Gordonia zhenghanii]MCF8572099.1 multidrug efflux SMR transporter [Gordonia zhenghanii]MCF8602973.1 multidrug efflux SMR transporter [Gordonia zhenghanii]